MIRNLNNKKTKNKRRSFRCCQFSERLTSLLLMVLWQEADETVIITSLHTSIYFYSSTRRIITVIHRSDSGPSWAYASKKKKILSTFL